jgi:transcriptional regulator with XRE-family HTH domain
MILHETLDLRRLRLARGLSQSAVAAQSGIAQQRLSALEHGRVPDPRLSTVRRLAKIYQCSCDDVAVAVGASCGEGA